MVFPCFFDVFWSTLELFFWCFFFAWESEVKDLFQAGDFLKQAEDWTSQASQAATERVVEFNSIYELDCWSGRIVNLDMNEDENPRVRPGMRKFLK